ncbi:MAG: hypothetical protein AB1505_35190, partial [Candidatus Latescibacterota bacterium]
EPLHAVAASAGRVLLAVADRIEVFDPAALRFERSLRPDAPCHHLARLGPERVAAFCGDELWRIDPASGEMEQVGVLPGRVHTAAVTPAGQLYGAVGTHLYRIDL